MLTPVHGYCPPVHSGGVFVCTGGKGNDPRAHLGADLGLFLFNNIKQQFFLAKQKSNLYVCRY